MTTMTPLESFTRLAAVGVSVEGLAYTNAPRDGFTVDGVFVRDTHATALLEAKWHRKYPHLTVENDGIGNIIVHDWTLRQPNNGIAMGDSRLEAMVLAAEAKHKENSDAR